MPLIRHCKVCNLPFKTKPYFIKTGGGIYCSKQCHYKGLKRGEVVKCFICSKEVYKSPQSLRRSKSKKFFCSKSCQTKWRNTEFVGEKHSNWIHGEQAYRSVLSRNNIEKVCKFCKTKDERILSTHHIDRNRKNNRLNNLIWLCHNCHFLVHNYRAGKEFGLSK